MINGASGPVTFVIQQGRPGEWSRVIDTSLPSPDDFRDPGGEVNLLSSEYALNTRSIVVLLRK
jgi:glycogen operon protein